MLEVNPSERWNLSRLIPLLGEMLYQSNVRKSESNSKLQDTITKPTDMQIFKYIADSSEERTRFLDKMSTNKKHENKLSKILSNVRIESLLSKQRSVDHSSSTTEVEGRDLYDIYLREYNKIVSLRRTATGKIP
jgi:hypothetical protein